MKSSHIRHPSSVPHIVFANDAGEIIDLPGIEMAGRSGGRFLRPALDELVPLPEGSELFVLEDRRPIGIDPSDGRPAIVETDPFKTGGRARAVAAFIAPAHTSIYWAAFQRSKKRVISPLPLFAYTAVGWLDGQFWVAAFRSDMDIRQDASGFDQKKIRTRTLRLLKQNPDNRLIQHLGKCCLTYACPAARNYFLGRWEAPLPTSPACNADCVGCISLQSSGCCPSSQERISFVPSPAEIEGIAVPHLMRAPRPIVSFGQGCEGEPLLQAKVIEQAVRAIRSQTEKGTINLNTNASLPEKVERLAAAGLDSIRISLNSARDEKHRLYYRPKGFSLTDVKESACIMKRRKKFVSLNYFILPGFTDDPEETAAFFDLVSDVRPDFIQLRNLNMDPDWYLESVRHSPSGEPLGILNWLERLKENFPFLRFGYFNPYLG